MNEWAKDDKQRDPPSRYDHGLAEFPAFRFGTRRDRQRTKELIQFNDTIRSPTGERIERKWTVYPSAQHGYGGRSTHALLFDLHQVWQEDGFKGHHIHFGTLNKLYQRREPDRPASQAGYNRMRRDPEHPLRLLVFMLGILLGTSYPNVWWNWHIFSGWYEAHRRRADDPQEELPLGFVEVSPTFARLARERGFFVTGFSPAFFHELGPMEQRLALYLSKMFVSQSTHWRHED